MITANENIMLKTLQENFEVVKAKNQHDDRMYILGLMMVLQFSDNIEMQKLIGVIHSYLNSTLPTN
jgi:hypothetical protein